MFSITRSHSFSSRLFQSRLAPKKSLGKSYASFNGKMKQNFQRNVRKSLLRSSLVVSQQSRSLLMFHGSDVGGATPVMKSGSRGLRGIEGLLDMPTGKLSMKDGTVLEGVSFGAEKSVAGEVVFNTGMVGYPESLTDPSYTGQILVLTYPLVGNYGVPSFEKDEFGLPKYFESDKIQISALIVSDYSMDHHHHEAFNSLGQWLKDSDVPALFGVDTRELTKNLRDNGSVLGKIEFGNDNIEMVDVNSQNLAAQVSRTEIQYFGSGSNKIIAVDLGMKNNLIRYLARADDVSLKVVPWDYDFTNEEFDGLFLSNGPGDPEMVEVTTQNVKKLMESKPDVPIFGICLGNQILARAAGASTYKMKFGNRGMNQPVIDLRTTRCYITPQNHGYAVDESTLPDGWEPFFTNANDRTNEGIIHKTKPWFSVQFHPEAAGGPTDTEFLFDMFLKQVTKQIAPVTTVNMPQKPTVKKVLLLGSGGLSIGQAGEFDYSGSQAIKALKEQNVEVVLVNPNIATVQTAADMADTTYFEPVTPEFVEKIIAKENPDSILLQFGGQTALNTGVDLADRGVLDKYNVQVLGTTISTIKASEDRQQFADKLAEINEKTAPCLTAANVEDALEAAEKIGYPVLVRTAFALGGLGSGFACNPEEMKELTLKAFANTSQVIIDKSLRGWKEIEYEVVRDAFDNCITVCNMENFDPLGIHTGDSIVVAPSQTLTNTEYYMLRQTAIKVIRHLGVVGECNIQYALNPESHEYYIIEVNPRLSRSSALASKATGYPLAYVAAKLALGHGLPDIKNSVTKTTSACFEPSLDYCVVKIPRWDMRKFNTTESTLGSQMKSVGEVMAIGRKFEEAFQKAIRMFDDSLDGFGDRPSYVTHDSDEALETALSEPDDSRVFAIAQAMQSGYSIDEIFDLTKIDKWFLYKLRNIVRAENTLKMSGGLSNVPPSVIKHAKQIGFSDHQIGRCTSVDPSHVREIRKGLGIIPVVKQIDTLAAEFPAQTNYLYMTYNGDSNDVEFDDKGTMVLGCGAYRIGSSCEFDWCAVSCNRTLQNLGYNTIMVNYNPETVSTDFDECDKLYFEELSHERILDIYEAENSAGVIVSVGGQIPNNLAMPLHKSGVTILGTQPDSIDNAEDRGRFSSMLDDLDIDQPRWMALTSKEAAVEFTEDVGYPVLVRPSYVLSGAAMNVVHSQEDLERCLNQAVELSSEFPVVISKFILGAQEIEMDAVASDGEVINYAIHEHVENAGVHSGDATLIIPAQSLSHEQMTRVRKTGRRIARALNITGPFNIQFLSKDDDLKVIECNLRASRSFPFVSKALNSNFIEQATRAIVGAPRTNDGIFANDVDYVCIKAPKFSFPRLAGVDPVLRVEMASTGEVACFGENKYEAYVKSLVSAGFVLPKKNTGILLRTGNPQQKDGFVEYAKKIEALGYPLYGTSGTVAHLREHGVNIERLNSPSEGDSQDPSVIDYLRSGKIEMMISIPKNFSPEETHNGFVIRRTAVDYNVPLLTDFMGAQMFVDALVKIDTENLDVKSWSEHLNNLDENLSARAKC